MIEALKPVLIYTDGACIGNPGPGGYGVVLIYGDHRKELSAGFRLTTNNRMEIMAAIVGLQALKQKCEVTIFTDSQYLIDTIMKGWAQRWKSNNWMRNKKDKAINTDLWSQMLELCSLHIVTFKWVRGHSGIPENERCDQLAVKAAQSKPLLIDFAYESLNFPLPVIKEKALFD